MGGQIVTNTQQIDPIPVVTGQAKYPSYLVAKMRAAGVKVDALDCVALAREAGSVKAVNLVLLGRLSHYFDFPEEVWQEAIASCVPQKFLEMNRKAFALGRTEGTS
jgi:indolepyruvate ferredoxin oxidoreductase beta subunit